MEGSVGGVAGEVRKVHVVYFLSRDGEMEQPHLIRVRHRNRRDGVRLRDVKRWLSELRGKNMPDSFAWSYKRRYKTGYVWQDLADDDLNTPISDNEYVLKGSLTTTSAASSATVTTATRSFSSSSMAFSSPSAATTVVSGRFSPAPERASEDSARADPAAADPFRQRCPETPPPPGTPQVAAGQALRDQVSPEPPPTPGQEEPATPSRPPPPLPGCMAATSAVDAAAHRAEPPLPISSGGEIEDENPAEQGKREENRGAEASELGYCLLWGNRRGCSWCGGAGSRRSYMFSWNLLRCGVGASQQVDEAASLPIEPRRRGASYCGSSREGRKNWTRSCAGCATEEQKNTTVPAAAHKPAAEPRCSQCGRPFKPERLHAHMRSCRALKNQLKKTDYRRLSNGGDLHNIQPSKEESSLFLIKY